MDELDEVQELRGREAEEDAMKESLNIVRIRDVYGKKRKRSIQALLDSKEWSDVESPSGWLERIAALMVAVGASRHRTAGPPVAWASRALGILWSFEGLKSPPV